MISCDAVVDRVFHAMRTLRALPDRERPKGFRSCMPEYSSEYPDMAFAGVADAYPAGLGPPELPIKELWHTEGDRQSDENLHIPLGWFAQLKELQRFRARPQKLVRIAGNDWAQGWTPEMHVVWQRSKLFCGDEKSGEFFPPSFNYLDRKIGQRHGKYRGWCKRSFDRSVKRLTEIANA